MIKYKSGFKYQIVWNYSVKTKILPSKSIRTKYLSLNTKGRIVIRSGYAYDGPSGPTVDTKNFMRGSLVHDAFYQLMRMEKLDGSWRHEADKELRRMCLEDGMSRIRAWWVYRAVRLAGGPSADPAAKKKVYSAP